MKPSDIALLIWFNYSLFCSETAPARTYATNFLLGENPLFEGGEWINGGTVGLDWANVETSAGFAFGTQSGSTGYDDSTAILSGRWGSNQTAIATVHYTTYQCCPPFEEVELRLRTSISAHGITGYEINYNVNPTPNAYLQIVRWNGPLSSFTYVNGANGPGIHDWDTVQATIVGSTITAYVNGVVALQGTATTYTNGAPGIGFYLELDGNGTPALDSDYGFTSFTATDGIEPPLIPLSTLLTNGQFAFSFPTVAGQSYTIQQNANLASASWVNLTNFVGTSLPYQFSAPTTNSELGAFFRVRVP